eukprot:SRR837773.23136.p4 GENE.SRR837773.23136~~SRR837773.23136.p4  ORF type:complete len:104 (+),score=12.25 SRR837773.23136:184-495(+)
MLRNAGHVGTRQCLGSVLGTATSAGHLLQRSGRGGTAARHPGRLAASEAKLPAEPSATTPLEPPSRRQQGRAQGAVAGRSSSWCIVALGAAGAGLLLEVGAGR